MKTINENNELDFAADSSPQAWEHYKKYWSGNFDKYNLDNPCFFNYVSSKKQYGNKPKKKNNCLYALLKNSNDYKPQLRLGGETDFNFSDKRAEHFKTLICLEDNNKQENLKLLKRCQKMHNDYFNFSLMQTMGNMQGFKGRWCEDRLDRFLYFLNQYYELSIEDRQKNADAIAEKSVIILFATKPNRKYLVEYLNEFSNIYDYCKKVYLIGDEDFVDELIVNGSKPINTGSDVRAYMDIAIRFWEKKERYFKNNSTY